ncbi:MAG: carboxynorspermidine decarboxylase [Deltaproteobacteria bacterium]|nr:carboxynorspermidine decarboxylase [Deltaproteobacteria bacterium]
MRERFLDARIPTPCYVVDEAALIKNLKILDSVQRQTGCRILLALKGFAMFSLFSVIREYLCGISASSVDEARLGHEEFGKEVHFCAPAFPDADFNEILSCCNHLVFNSFSFWNRYKSKIMGAQKLVRCGIRVNPEHSEVSVPIYDPCGPCSRLGVTRVNFEPQNLEGISGLHFHTLCELNADALARTLPAFEDKFGAFLKNMEWVNFGGGHHITRSDYDVNLLCELITGFKNRYPIEVYLEPGEAVALNTGVLIASVLDVFHNNMDIAILDTSASAHMPDVLEMPYRPVIEGAGMPGEYPFTYRLAGLTCLAGDVIGDFSFPAPLSVGDRLVFQDMAHYTMVKNNTFNGVRLPSIGILTAGGEFRLVRKFGYSDYRNRLS